MVLLFSYEVTYLDVILLSTKYTGLFSQSQNIFYGSRTFEHHTRSFLIETDFMKMCQKNVTKLENNGEFGSRFRSPFWEGRK